MFTFIMPMFAWLPAPLYYAVYGIFFLFLLSLLLAIFRILKELIPFITKFF